MTTNGRYVEKLTRQYRVKCVDTPTGYVLSGNPQALHDVRGELGARGIASREVGGTIEVAR